MLTYCWGQTRFSSFFLTHFYGFVFFSFFAVRCWMWPSRTSSWGLWSQPAPDLACPKLSRCFDRFLRASCVWKWPSAVRFLTHSHQTVFFWWFRLGAPFHCIWLAHLWHLFSIRFTYVSQCCSQALPLGTVREVLDVPLQDWVLERFDIHNEVQIDSWNLVTFTMTHVQPGVEIYLTRGKAKCFVSTCGVAADNMRTSQASSMIVFASALVLTFCVAFSFLFFSSLPFFVGDFFSCFFLLQVNLRAANRLGWQGKDGEKPFVGMRLCSNHRRLACWPYTEHKRTIERQAINMYASCLFFSVRQVQTVAWGGVHPQFSLSLSLSVWPSCRRVGWNAPQQRRKRRPGRTRKLRCRLSWHVFSCVFFFGEFDPLWGCRPVKASRPDDGGQAEEGSSGADWVGMFSAPFFGGGNLTCFEAAAVSKAKAKAIAACTFLLRWLLCGRRLRLPWRRRRRRLQGECVFLHFLLWFWCLFFKGTTAIPIGVLVCYLCNENHLTLCDTKTLIPSRTWTPSQWIDWGEMSLCQWAHFHGRDGLRDEGQIASVSPFHLGSWLLSFVCSLFGGGFWLWCFSLKYPGFLQLLHRSPSQYKRFADRPRLELDRLPRKKKTLIPSGATNKTALNSYRFCFLFFVWYNSKEKGKYFRIMLTSSFGPWWLVGLMFERRNWW